MIESGVGERPDISYVINLLCVDEQEDRGLS